MSGQTSSVSERSRTYWTPPMERFFIDLLLDQVYKGHRTGYTFNKQAWTDMLENFNAKFGSKYDKDVMKVRYKCLWEQYNDVKTLLEQNGFAWDEGRQMVTASDYEWEAYIKIHQEMRSYKTKPVLNYNDLCVIFEYTTADGRYSFSSHDVDFDTDAMGMKIADGLVGQIQSVSDRSRTHWTPATDRFFVDLMLDQVSKGNKIDYTFNKQAWTEMITLFNEKFGSDQNKNVLRSRYKILRKHYSDMKILLRQSGFSLDESRQMVVAEDSVWDAYIKAHPRSRSLKTTTVPDFNDLYMIYGDEIADGRKVRPIHDADLDDESHQMQIGKEKHKQISNGCDRSRTYWTPPMDRYLIDLMLDQVRKGNKTDSTFIAHAWAEMTMLFNVKFGSRHDKEVLKNRFKSLRKQHNDIKTLLNQWGFSWDETRQMVKAEDDIWDAYIKDHPDARSYRIKIVPNFHDLRIICGNTTPYERCIQLEHSVDDENDVQRGRIGEEMGSEDQTSYNIGTHWTTAMKLYFLQLMLEVVPKGNTVGNSFNEDAWGTMTMLFNAKFGCQYEENALKNQYQTLRKKYSDVQILLGQNGFSWDEQQQMIVADDEVWNSFIQIHPDVQSYRCEHIPSYSSLCMMFGNSSADVTKGYFHDIPDFNGDVPGEGSDNKAPNVRDGSRTYWTPLMDCYFIDLMLDQLCKGNKVNHTFTKQAWTDMMASFNTKFKSQHEKDVLKSRYKNLRKQYNDITNILDQNGFTWDETRQMIIANDDVWDAYLKEHPDARSYRTKTATNYNSLKTIYGERTGDRINNHFADVNISDRSRTYWMPPMDRYFIDLMLEQVQNGSKTDHAFSKQAWVHMTALFNAKFGSQLDKDVFKSRHKTLRKQHENITILLSQTGFRWDDLRHLVIADDDVWDAYIKENPDGQSYRMKILANYNDLCKIYGTGNEDTRESPDEEDLEIELEASCIKNDATLAYLQPSATDADVQRNPFNAMQESIPHLGRDKGTSNRQRKRSSAPTSTSIQARKVRKRGNSIRANALGEMSGVLTCFGNKKKESKESVPIEDVMGALKAVPDMDGDLMLDACDLLEDERKAKTFLALDSTLRKKWLMRKLRP